MQALVRPSTFISESPLSSGGEEMSLHKQGMPPQRNVMDFLYQRNSGGLQARAREKMITL